MQIIDADREHVLIGQREAHLVVRFHRGCRPSRMARLGFAVEPAAAGTLGERVKAAPQTVSLSQMREGWRPLGH